MSDAHVARAPLSVETDLTLSVDDAEATVSSTGERLFVEFPSMAAAVRALRGLPPTGRREFHEVLLATDLALEVRVHHRTVAALGVGARPGVLSRQLGVDPVAVRVGGLLSAVGAELSAGVRHVRSLFG